MLVVALCSTLGYYKKLGFYFFLPLMVKKPPFLSAFSEEAGIVCDLLGDKASAPLAPNLLIQAFLSSYKATPILKFL